jgi:D-alanyl-D-alanine dipeptidase
MKKVYDVENVFKIKTVKALVKANEILKTGSTYKLFDCYRPLIFRRKCGKLYRIQYVADPAKGSIHNRGGAITLVDKNGKELGGDTI